MERSEALAGIACDRVCLKTRDASQAVARGAKLDPSGLYFPMKWQVSTNGRIDGQESLFK